MGQALSIGFRKAGGVTKERKPDKGTKSGGQTPGDCERQNIAGNTREPEKTDSVQSLCSENNSLDGDKKQNPPACGPTQETGRSVQDGFLSTSTSARGSEDDMPLNDSNSSLNKNEPEGQEATRKDNEGTASGKREEKTKEGIAKKEGDGEGTKEETPYTIEKEEEEKPSSGSGSRKVECFRDLTRNEASNITDGLGQTAMNLLRRELEKELGQSETPLAEMMLQSKGYRIRTYTNLITDDERASVIKLFRRVLPTQKGVIGPLLKPDMLVKDIKHSCRDKLTRSLCADDRWKTLADRLGVEVHDIRYYDRRKEDPVDAVLRDWEFKGGSTVGNLYDHLVDLELPVIADYL